MLCIVYCVVCGGSKMRSVSLPPPLGPCVTVKHFNLLHENVCVNLLTRAVVVPTVASCWLSLCDHAVTGRLGPSSPTICVPVTAALLLMITDPPSGRQAISI